MASAPSSKKLKKAHSTAHPVLEAGIFDAGTQKSLDEINNTQKEIEALNKQASEEILQVKQKFNQLRKPHFDKRAEVINKVPNFWLTVFRNHPILSSLFEEGAEDRFRHLIKLDVEEFEDIKSGYKIHFHFKENSYFENTVLTKEFHLESPDAPTSLSVPIRWKKGMDLTRTNKPTRRGRKRRINQRSFFAWYNDHINPTSDVIAKIIKDDLWDNPLRYFVVPHVEVGNSVDDDSYGSSSEDYDAEDSYESSSAGDDDEPLSEVLTTKRKRSRNSSPW